MKTVYFLVSPPRTGCTALSAILNQNPYVYVSRSEEHTSELQ